MKAIPCLFLVCLVSAGCATNTSDRIPENRIERQMLGLIEKFDRWDINGDGRLDIDELSAASKVTGIPPQDILEFYDTNKDGSITLSEAQNAYQRRVDQRP